MCYSSLNTMCVPYQATVTMSYVEGRIMFAKLKGFPILDDNSKIQTQCFIDGAKEVVSLIEQFGTLFTPVVYDMNGNIEKIKKIFTDSKQQSPYLEDLILHELKTPQGALVDSLLWLKRALDLLEQFFRNVVNDMTLQQSLTSHLQKAYAQTLKPYHGFIVQTAFSVVYRFIPNRTELIGNQDVKQLIEFLDPLRSHINRISAFYTQHNLDHQNKVHGI